MIKLMLNEQVFQPSSYNEIIFFGLWSRSVLKPESSVYNNCVWIWICVCIYIYIYILVCMCSLHIFGCTCIYIYICMYGASLVAHRVKNPSANAGDVGSILGSGRSPGEGNDYPLHYSCLENSMDRGAWRATAHGVSKNQTGLYD